MDGTTAHIEVPATPPDADVWELAAADLGGNAALLAIGIAVLWRFLKSMIDKMLATSSKAADDADARAKEQAGAADARTERLMAIQGTAIESLTTAVHKVREAVVRSDEHNQAAIASLRATMDRHETRLDRVDVRLDAHGERITTVEHVAGVHRLPRTGNGQG